MSLMSNALRPPAAGSPEPTSAPAVGTTRVMLIDDSLTVRTVFARMIGGEPDLAVVAQAGTAEKALMMLRNMEVDVILLDLEMPGMGGIEALPRLLETESAPQVMVVSSLTADGAEATVTALGIGAADTMLKPRPGGFNDEYKQSLLGKIRALGDRSASPGGACAQREPAAGDVPHQRPRALAIGASTGGIHALNLFLRKLPPSFDLPILITQHLPESFLPVFARQMETAAGRKTVLGADGVTLAPGQIVIAPGHAHMTLQAKGGEVVVVLAHHAVPSGCRPSVDPMFESLADVYHGQAAAILLSGMGRDGTDGARRLAEAGGIVLAQDEASCAVWGMPKTVAESGIAQAVLPPAGLAELMGRLAGVPA